MQIEASIESAAQRLADYRVDPVGFVKAEFKVTPDPWQGDIISAYPSNPRIALQACVGPGKTAVLAWIALNFAITRPRPKIACTSITWPNLRDNLWSEFSKWMAASELLSSVLTWTQMKIFANDDPQNTWISARTWDRSADAENQAQTLSGLHEDYIMAIADETGAMPPAVLDAAEGVLSSCVEGHIIQAGNPLDTAGALYQATDKQRQAWKVIRITGDPDDPARAVRVDLEWAKSQVERYGRDHIFVRTKILGLYPLQSADALISRPDMKATIDRTHDKLGVALVKGFRVMGVDVARFGTDHTVCCIRDGDYVDRFITWAHKPTTYTAERVAAMCRELDISYVVIDDIGVGGGVTDMLKRMVAEDVLPEVRIKGLNVGEASTLKGSDDQPLYFNLKSELNMETAEKRFVKGRISFTPEAYETPVSQQGVDIRYSFGRGGRVFMVEPKEEYKKRNEGTSPDYWDSLILAFFPAQFSAAGIGWVA